MVLWSTLMMLKEEVSRDDFYSMVRKWRLGSPHTKLCESDIASSCSDELHVEKDGEQFIFYALKSALACRYSATEGTDQWITDLVYAQTELGTMCSITLHFSSSAVSFRRPKMHTPYIVKMILKEGLVKSTGEFEMGGQPKQLQDDDVNLVARLIRGETNAFLPVIYVASEYNGSVDKVFLGRLSAKASGIAHVIVEPSRLYARKIAQITGRLPLPAGSLTVFVRGFANGILFRQKHSESRDRQMVRALSTARDIMVRATSSLKLNFQSVEAAYRALMVRRKMLKLQEENRQGVEFAELCDQTVKDLERQVMDRDAEIEELKRKLIRTRDERVEPSCFQLDLGREELLYEEEGVDAILTALQNGVSSLSNHGRYRKIIDIILANNRVSAHKTYVKSTLERILLNGKYTSGRIGAALRELGFSLREDGKHFVLSHGKDPSVMVTIAKTPSDTRGIRNEISDLLRQLFQ